MVENHNLSIHNKTKGKLPSLPFGYIKDAVLGKDYDLSIAIVSKEEIKKINNHRRQKNHATDILSFSLDKNSGEIILNLDMIKKKAPDFDRNFEKYLGFVFIHGLVHLKGFDHGSKMESIEKKFREKFGF